MDLTGKKKLGWQKNGRHFLGTREAEGGKRRNRSDGSGIKVRYKYTRRDFQCQKDGPMISKTKKKEKKEKDPY